MSDNLEATFRIFVQYCASMLLDEKFTRGAARKDDDREYFLPAIAKVRAHVERCRRSLQENMGQDTIRKHGDTWEIVSKLPSLEINSRFEENCSQEISEFVDDGDQECERCCGRKKVAMYDVALKGEAYDQLALIYPHQAPKREVCPDYISWSTCASCTKWIALYHNSCHFDLHILCAISRKIRPGLDKGDEIRAILHAVMYDEDWIAHHFGNFSKVNRSVQDTLDQVRVGSILKSTQDTRDPKPEEVKWVLEMAFCARDYIASEDQTQKAKENKSKPPNILPNKQFENRPKRRKISCIDLFSDSDAEDKQEKSARQDRVQPLEDTDDMKGISLSQCFGDTEGTQDLHPSPTFPVKRRRLLSTTGLRRHRRLRRIGDTSSDASSSGDPGKHKKRPEPQCRRDRSVSSCQQSSSPHKRVAEEYLKLRARDRERCLVHILRSLNHL